MTVIENYKKYPWYFQVNRVFEAWELSRKADGIVVDLVDTCVDFERPQLKGRNYSFIEKCNFIDSKSKAYKMHGTAMAGLICADKSTLIEDYRNTKVNIAGVAPKALIKVITTPTDQGKDYMK